MPGLGGEAARRPVRVLHGIPNHWAYRRKLEAKWERRGYVVRFA